MKYVLVCFVASACFTTFGMHFEHKKYYNSQSGVGHLTQEVNELKNKYETLRKQKEKIESELKDNKLDHTIVLKKKDDQIKELQQNLQKLQTESSTLFNAAQLLVKTEEKKLANTNRFKPKFRDSVVMLLTLCIFIGIQEFKPLVNSYLYK